MNSVPVNAMAAKVTASHIARSLYSRVRPNIPLDNLARKS